MAVDSQTCSWPPQELAPAPAPAPPPNGLLTGPPPQRPGGSLSGPLPTRGHTHGPLPACAQPRWHARGPDRSLAASPRGASSSSLTKPWPSLLLRPAPSSSPTARVRRQRAPLPPPSHGRGSLGPGGRAPRRRPLRARPPVPALSPISSPGPPRGHGPPASRTPASQALRLRALGTSRRRSCPRVHRSARSAGPRAAAQTPVWSPGPPSLDRVPFSRTLERGGP